MDLSMEACYADTNRPSSGKYVMKGEQSSASRAALKSQLMKLKQAKDQPSSDTATSATLSPHVSSSSTAKASSSSVKATDYIKPILNNLQTPSNPLLRSKKTKNIIRSTDGSAYFPPPPSSSSSSSSREVEEVLPTGWMEKVDKRSSRTFYVNT